MKRKYGIIVTLVAVMFLWGGPAFATETVTYTYDEQGRLVTVTSSGTVNNGETVTIAVDAADNRVTYTVTGA